MTADPATVQQRLGSGLLAFPATHFRADGAFDETAFRASIPFNIDNGAVALFAPGGTGEFFSLTLDEYKQVLAAAIAEAKGRVPIVGGVGYGTAMAIEFARAAEKAGADAILVLPPYLLNVEQAGLQAHIEAICRAVGIGVIVYNRDNSIFATSTVQRLADTCANLIGFKDGVGDVEQLVSVRQGLGDRLVYIGGMPTAEVYAVPYFAAGFTTYSSAIFNFIPKTAMKFYRAVRAGDAAVTDDLMKRFFMPYLALRNRRRGYAVSIVKAGMHLVGRPAGPVRAPLTDLTDADLQELRRIMDSALGPQAA